MKGMGSLSKSSQQLRLSSFIRRLGGSVRRCVFIGVSLSIGTVVLIGWAVLVRTEAACKLTWVHGWELLYAITYRIPATLLARLRHNNSASRI